MLTTNYLIQATKLKIRVSSGYFGINSSFLIDVTKEADLTWLYIIAIIAGFLIVVISTFVMLHFRSARKTNKEAILSRNRGVATWGTKIRRGESSSLNQDESYEEESLAEMKSVKVGSK